MTTMRVLVISTSYPIRKGSISGIFIKHLVVSLAKYTKLTVITPGDDQGTPANNTNSETLIVCNYAPKKLQTLAHKPGGIPARIRNNRLMGIFVPLLLASMILRIIFQSKHHDIIHCNWAISGLMAGSIKWFIKRPIVTTLRGEDVNQRAGGSSQFILKACLKYSDKVVLVSGDMHRELVDKFPQYRHKFSTIHNGVDTLFINSRVNKNIQTIPPLRLITVGSLVPRKNVSYILDALALCQKRGLDFEYTIIGDGEECHQLLASAKNIFNKKINFLGELTPSQVADELGKSHIFITSSLHEGRPNSVIEAMASGLCVIASDIPGHCELIKDGFTGRIFSLSKPENLETILCELMETPSEINDFGDKARELILSDKFSWDSCAQNYYKLFESIYQHNHINNVS